MPIHHLMVGTWKPPGAIFTFAFDDQSLTLTLVKRTEIPSDEPISWMTFNHNKTAIYGAAMKKWSSYTVINPQTIVHQASHPMLHDPAASSTETNTRAIFVLAARHPPYGVYCNPFYDHAGHGTIFTPDPITGALTSPALQHYPYQPNSGVHGMVLSPSITDDDDERYLYSADLAANKLWVHHRPDPSSPAVELVAAIDAPSPHDHPRWLAIHPSGAHLYVLMETGNRLCEYAVDATTRVPTFTGRHFPLIIPPSPPPLPSEANSSSSSSKDNRGYRADVCALSHSSRYLFATSRANRPGQPGYITALALRPSDGRIERQCLLRPTRTSGGHSNAVAPADWSDDWLALTDEEQGWLEMYRWHDEDLVCVARLCVPEPGFGMNAIWYD